VTQTKSDTILSSLRLSPFQAAPPFFYFYFMYTKGKINFVEERNNNSHKLSDRYLKMTKTILKFISKKFGQIDQVTETKFSCVISGNVFHKVNYNIII